MTSINASGVLHSFLKEEAYMDLDIEKLRKKHMDNPPEGITSGAIRRMGGDGLPDMDYFLNEDESDDGFGGEGFYIF